MARDPPPPVAVVACVPCLAMAVDVASDVRIVAAPALLLLLMPTLRRIVARLYVFLQGLAAAIFVVALVLGLLLLFVAADDCCSVTPAR